MMIEFEGRYIRPEKLNYIGLVEFVSHEGVCSRYRFRFSVDGHLHDSPDYMSFNECKEARERLLNLIN